MYDRMVGFDTISLADVYKTTKLCVKKLFFREDFNEDPSVSSVN